MVGTRALDVLLESVFMSANEISSVAFPKLESSCYEYLACICPGEGMGSVPVVSFDVEHDLIDQFLL